MKTREALKTAFAGKAAAEQTAGGAEPDGDEPSVVGLSENPQGIPFQCGTCEYFADGVCQNPHPKLNGQKVQPEWCCNLYDHEGMKVITQ